LFTAIKAAIFSLTVLVTFTGCIYSNTVVPYSTEFNETPIGTKSCVINSYKLTEPVSGYNMYAEWSTEFILKEAKKAGINNIYYIDKKVLSVLGDTFKRETLIIYGD
jgi:hypothetical protein